eukprot:15407053-Alexandrium_andersonii.AAC.1
MSRRAARPRRASAGRHGGGRATPGARHGVLLGGARGVERLSTRLPLDPVRPADLDRLSGHGRVDLDGELSAKPDVATPKI